jgi:hypothetical protein
VSQKSSSMSRSIGDRQQQQQPQQHNQNQQIIQPIQQVVRTPSATPQQQQHFIIVNNSNSIGLNANDAILRTPSNVVNTIQSSIYYSTPPAVASGSSAVVNANVQQSTPTSHLDPTSPIAKKRLKLEVADSSSSCGSTNTTEDLSALKKRILEHKLLRLKGLKEK